MTTLSETVGLGVVFQNITYFIYTSRWEGHTRFNSGYDSSNTKTQTTNEVDGSNCCYQRGHWRHTSKTNCGFAHHTLLARVWYGMVEGQEVRLHPKRSFKHLHVCIIFLYFTSPLLFLQHLHK